MPDVILYEQPLNETIRASLRIEQLFHQLDQELNDASALGTRHTLTTLIHLLNVLERGDLKTKLAKEMNLYLSNLSRLAGSANLDRSKLLHLTDELENTVKSFINSSGRIAQNLREIELLNQLRLHLATFGCNASFDLPIYHYWLNQPEETRKHVVMEWLQELSFIRSAVYLLLRIVRNNSKIENKTAVHGFYQELLDPAASLRMIQIHVPDNTPAFPEISIGRHFLSIRFAAPNLHKRPQQYTESFPFTLTYCFI